MWHFEYLQEQGLYLGSKENHVISLLKERYEWKLVAGLYRDTISIESAKEPGFFLASKNQTLYLSAYEDSTSFTTSASFFYETDESNTIIIYSFLIYDHAFIAYTYTNRVALIKESDNTLLLKWKASNQRMDPTIMPCDYGTFSNKTSDRRELCSKCPSGSFTLQKGSKSIDACVGKINTYNNYTKSRFEMNVQI